VKIMEISIRNFKSFGDMPVTIPLTAVTTLVGANSSGKTNVLKALDIFFDYSKKKITTETFYERDTSKPIEILIVFHGLDDQERRVFRRNLSPDGSLRIKQRIKIPPKDDPEKKAISQDGSAEIDDIEGALDQVTQEKRGIHIIAVPGVIDWLNLGFAPTVEQVVEWWQTDLKVGDVDFKDYFESADIPSPEEFKNCVNRFWEENEDEIPQIEWLNETKPTKTKIKSWWRENLTVGDIDFKTYFEDIDSVPDPNTFSQAVERFWDEHSDNMSVMQHEASEKVLGWANKLKGNLPNLIYIPAIRHVHEEIKVAKTNPFGMLLYWLLGDIPKSRKDELQTQINKAIADVFSQSSELEEEQRRIDIIRTTLNQFIQDQFDISIDFEFPPPQLDDLLSGNANIVGDDGFRSPIQEKGQGVQRSLMFSILRTYCEHRKEFEESEQRNNIYAIEEPEICLHPAIKRATYRLLRRLSEGDDQVIYSTHDGYFVDVRFFDEVRVLRRQKHANGKWETRVWYFPVKHLILDAKNRYGKDITGESIRERFGRFYDPTKNEGFFAKKVILVEGPTEENALPIYFRALEYDVDQEQIAIINAGSVQHMDCLFIVFNELGIPCYVIFDGDKPMIDPFDPSTLEKKKRDDLKEKSERNKNHLKMFGVPELVDNEVEYFFPPTTINDHVTVFEYEFEVEVHHTIPNYDKLKSDAGALFGNDSKPLIARYIANEVIKDPESISPILREILEQVKMCIHHGSCLILDEKPAEDLRVAS